MLVASVQIGEASSFQAEGEVTTAKMLLVPVNYVAYSLTIFATEYNHLVMRIQYAFGAFYSSRKQSSPRK